MKLDAYLRAQNLSSAKFAKATGALTKQAVHNYRHGFRFPSPENLRLIQKTTNGAVTPEDFVDQHAGAIRAFTPANDATPQPPQPPQPGKPRKSATSKPAVAVEPGKARTAGTPKSRKRGTTPEAADTQADAA